MLKFVYLVLISFLFCLYYVFIKLIIDQCPVFFILFFRSGVMLILLWFVCRFVYKKRSDHGLRYWKDIVVIALLEIIFFGVLCAYGIKYISVSSAVILTGSVPFISYMLSLFVMKYSQFSYKSVLSIAFGFLSLCVLFQSDLFKGHNQMLGASLILLAACSLSLALLWYESSNFTQSALVIVKDLNMITCLIVFPAMCFQHDAWSLRLLLDQRVAITLILSGVCGVFMYVGYVFLIKREGYFFTSLMSYIQPFFGVLIGVYVFDDHTPFALFLGLLCLLLSLYLSQDPKNRMKGVKNR